MLPGPHPAFEAHFADPLYRDEANPLAPFGSDEGFDTLYGWVERSEEVGRCTTVRWLVAAGDAPDALDLPETNGPEVDSYLIAAGFTLLYLTGRIDSEGKQIVLDALHRTYAYYAEDNPREPAVMARDLTAYRATDCPR